VKKVKGEKYPEPDIDRALKYLSYFGKQIIE